MMTPGKSVYISKTCYDRAMELVESGHFVSFGDVLTYSMRFMADAASIYGLKSLPRLERNNLLKKNVRIPPVLVEELERLNFSKESEIYEMALAFYLDIKGN